MNFEIIAKIYGLAANSDNRIKKTTIQLAFPVIKKNRICNLLWSNENTFQEHPQKIKPKLFSFLLSSKTLGPNRNVKSIFFVSAYCYYWKKFFLFSELGIPWESTSSLSHYFSIHEPLTFHGHKTLRCNEKKTERVLSGSSLLSTLESSSLIKLNSSSLLKKYCKSLHKIKFAIPV